MRRVTWVKGEGKAVNPRRREAQPPGRHNLTLRSRSWGGGVGKGPRSCPGRRRRDVFTEEGAQGGRLSHSRRPPCEGAGARRPPLTWLRRRARAAPRAATVTAAGGGKGGEWQKKRGRTLPARNLSNATAPPLLLAHWFFGTLIAPPRSFVEGETASGGGKVTAAATRRAGPEKERHRPSARACAVLLPPARRSVRAGGPAPPFPHRLHRPLKGPSPAQDPRLRSKAGRRPPSSASSPSWAGEVRAAPGCWR